MKLNSKRSETESRTQQCNIRDQNDPSIGSKLADMKQNSKRGETKSGTQPSIAIEMIREYWLELEPFMKPGFVPVATRFHSGNRPV